MEIFKTFYFDAAHDLPFLEKEHKCSNLHGHRFKLTIFVKKDDFTIGDNWVLDFNLIREIYEHDLKPILDHSYLNEVKGLEDFNPTCEAIAIFIWGILKDKISNLSKIVLMETETSGVIYRGELHVS